MIVFDIYVNEKMYGERTISSSKRENVYISINGIEFFINDEVINYINSNLYKNYYKFELDINTQGLFTFYINGNYDKNEIDFEIENPSGDDEITNEWILNMLKENHDEIFNNFQYSSYDLLNAEIMHYEIVRNVLILKTNKGDFDISTGEKNQPNYMRKIEVDGCIKGIFNPDNMTLKHYESYEEARENEGYHFIYKIPLQNGNIILKYQHDRCSHEFYIKKKQTEL